MPKTLTVAVKKLKLDLKNFRTVPQKNEVEAVQAIVSIAPTWFWGLTESLLEEDGYLPTENILVLKGGSSGSELIVKEGNRRIAALKLIHGLLPLNIVDVPTGVAKKIAAVTQEWRNGNAKVPCAVYEPSEANIVDRIVTLTHGKNQLAGRAGWTAVATARHNRDVNGAKEPALDLLERYLDEGKNLTREDAERWAGTYTVTVLDEVLDRFGDRFGPKTVADLVATYPNIPARAILDEIMFHIGSGLITFNVVRDVATFAAKYKIPSIGGPGAGTGGAGGSGGAGGGTGSGSGGGTGAAGGGGGTSGGTGGGTSGGGTGSGGGGGKRAYASNDPRSVKQALKTFAPVGNNRNKVVQLSKEAQNLKLDKNPIAFCFLLRSMFEISAKAYCDDHKATGGPKSKEPNGQDRKLVEVLKDITKHLTNNMKDQQMVKVLHGAITEIAKSDGLLSVTSMNQLVHNPKFSITPSDVSTVFGNVFPLLEAMN
jgi:hypothetical protein